MNVGSRNFAAISPTIRLLGDLEILAAKRFLLCSENLSGTRNSGGRTTDTETQCIYSWRDVGVGEDLLLLSKETGNLRRSALVGRGTPNDRVNTLRGRCGAVGKGMFEGHVRDSLGCT